LLFGLDLDDFHFSRDAFLDHDLTQAPECRLMRRTLFVVKEAHSHEVPPNSSCSSDGYVPLHEGSSVLLSSQALDEILGTPALPLGETLAYLIHHHTRRTVVLEPAEQLLLADREIDPSEVALEAAGNYLL
jgi:hypothetical protein